MLLLCSTQCLASSRRRIKFEHESEASHACSSPSCCFFAAVSQPRFRISRIHNLAWIARRCEITQPTRQQQQQQHQSTHATLAQPTAVSKIDSPCSTASQIASSALTTIDLSAVIHHHSVSHTPLSTLSRLLRTTFSIITATALLSVTDPPILSGDLTQRHRSIADDQPTALNLAQLCSTRVYSSTTILSTSSTAFIRQFHLHPIQCALQPSSQHHHTSASASAPS